MSYEEKVGIFSRAGMVSRETYNIINSFHKLNSHSKNSKYKDNFYPDKDWLDRLRGINRLNPYEIVKETNFDFEELKQEINNNNLYMKEEEKEKKKSKEKSKQLKENNELNSIFLKQSGKIDILKKRHIFESQKYKYYNEHIKRINKLKNDFNGNNLEKHQTSYNPKREFIYKKILTGPKWEKLTDRDVFNLNKLYKNYRINISADDKNKKIKNNNNQKNRNIKKVHKKMSLTHSIKMNNNIDLINQILTNINNNTNYTTNAHLHSSMDNKNNNNKIILTLALKNKSSLNDTNNQFFIIKPENILLNKNNSTNNIIRKEYLHGPDFKGYLDLEKVERRKKRLQKYPLAKITLSPNYSAIEANIKSFVRYQTKNVILIKKPRIFNGINSSEFLYDASKTFDKIYGNKMRAVPKFQKMMARPKDSNLPSFMNGLYSRLGLELESEKTLKMNNYENSKMYKSQSFFTKKKKNKFFRKIGYEKDVEKNKDKIMKDFNFLKKKFDKIKYIEYD